MFWRSREIYSSQELGSHARALLKSMGYSNEELNRPFIAIANAWSNICPGHVNLRNTYRGGEEWDS